MPRPVPPPEKPKKGLCTFCTGPSLFFRLPGGPQAAICRSQTAADPRLLTADGRTRPATRELRKSAIRGRLLAAGC